MLKKVFFFVLIVNIGILVADAQDEKPKLKKVSLSGTIEEMDKGLAKIVDGDDTEWIVKMERNAKFTYSGTAVPAWLKRGMWVRFTTDFNSKGEPQRSPKEVEVFLPKKGEKLGIYNAAKGKITNPFIKSSTPTPSERFMELTVAGRVKALRNKELQVEIAGRPTIYVKVDLDEQTKIQVDVADPTLIRKGDKVTIQGWEVPNSENAVLATSLTVTAKEPLAPKKRTAGSRASKKNDEKK
ncbi:MAG: hypothetical protein VB878_15265 [Pirellulaceae bacterium]